MWKPNESLDDFVVKASDIEILPPQRVSLRPTGEVELLKPLARFEGTAKKAVALAETSSAPRFSWFHRSLVASGAFAVAAIILASAIFIGIYEGPNQTEVSEVAVVSEVPAVSEVPEVADITEVSEIAENSEVAEVSDVPNSEIRNPQSAIRNQSASRNRKSSKPRRHIRSQYVVSDFTPTTLVIYIEKGQIKTLIEPQLPDFKKPL